MTIVEMLEKQAREIPDQVAVISREATLTYDQLNRVVNQMAGALLNRGLKARDLVCFMLPRMPELVITFLAVAKARGVAVPVNFEDPVPQTQTLLHRLAPRFLVVHTSLARSGIPGAATGRQDRSHRRRSFRQPPPGLPGMNSSGVRVPPTPACR